MTKSKDAFNASSEESGNNSALPAPSFIIVRNDDNGSRDIHIQNLTVKIPGEKGPTLVENLDLTLPRGSRTMLTGNSGTGKTTVAKAILNLWDHGGGVITMPSGVKLMAMSQHAYFPNTTIRGILNITPDDKCTFDDKELTKVLKAVGHDKLIEHIPGQQVEILIDDLMTDISQELADGLLDENEEDEQAPSPAERFMEMIKPLIDKHVQEQFNTVQYVPEAQKQNLLESLKKITDKNKNAVFSSDEAKNLCNDITKEIDIALVQPLYKNMQKIVPDIATKQKNRLLSYSPDKNKYFIWNMKRMLHKRLQNYMANKDTDDKARHININQQQADYICREITQDMRKAAQQYEQSGFLSRSFNAATWPLSAGNIYRKANASARELTSRLTAFMDKQLLTGEKLTLSGGERQRLTIAMVLLHKPDILIVDEITAALDKKNAQALYSEMIKQIPEDTTVISIAHNDHILKYHTHHADLAGKTIQLCEVRPDGGSALQDKKNAPAPGGP